MCVCVLGGSLCIVVLTGFSVHTNKYMYIHAHATIHTTVTLHCTDIVHNGQRERREREREGGREERERDQIHLCVEWLDWHMHV